MRKLKDMQMSRTLALPNGAATVTSPTAIDLGPGSKSNAIEFSLSTVALSAAQISDGKTIAIDVLWSDNSDLSSPNVFIAGAITLTGAGGVGCPAQEFLFGLPSTAKRYLFLRATGSDSGDASGASATVVAMA